ncbi:MAG: LPS export ABC transporter periplasmic protein LptC [Bacteroidales bacterium]|nr:LPS export ABC transporter periplasmic protein LptC [Bacteroidales bacterium]
MIRLSLKKNHKTLIFVTFVFSWVSTLISCTNNIDIASVLDNKEDKASITAKKSEIIYTENGKVKLKVIAPVTKIFQNVDQPYTEFPEGITVYNFSDSMEIESELTSNYANYYDKKKLWSASNNVIAKNKKGETLNTEHLFWDQNKKTIYTEDMVKITTADGIQYGQGFVSDEAFNNWEIKKPNSFYYLNENKEAKKDSTLSKK